MILAGERNAMPGERCQEMGTQGKEQSIQSLSDQWLPGIVATRVRAIESDRLG